MKTKPRTLMVLLMIGLLSACSEKQFESNQSVSDDAEENIPKSIKNVRIGYQKSGALAYVMQKRIIDDELAKQRITVSWTEFPSGPPMLEAMNTGNLDFGVTGETPPIFAQAAKSGLVYVGREAASPETEGFLLPKNSKIVSPLALKGKRIAFTKGSSSHYLVVLFLEKYQLNYNDIQATYLQPADARAAFEQGRIDAWAVWEPYLSAARIQLDGKPLVDVSGLKPHYAFYLASKEFAEKRPDLVKIILERINYGDKAIKENITDYVKIRTELTGLPNDIALESVKKQNFGVSFMSEEVLKEQQKVADTFFELGLIPKKLDVSEIVWYPN